MTIRPDALSDDVEVPLYEVARRCLASKEAVQGVQTSSPMFSNLSHEFDVKKCTTIITALNVFTGLTDDEYRYIISACVLFMYLSSTTSSKMIFK